MALVVEPDFASNLERGLPARLLLVTDASDPNTGTTMQAYARRVIDDYQTDLSEQRQGVRIEPRVRMRFNPTLESVNLFIPGLIALVLTLVSALMTPSRSRGRRSGGRWRSCSSRH